MSKNANAGELRTLIQIKSTEISKNANGYQNKDYTNIFGEDEYIRCKWVNAHGNEIDASSTLNLLETATITMRYSPLVNSNCVIIKRGETTPFEIINVDNVLEKNVWLEIKVQRMENAV